MEVKTSKRGNIVIIVFLVAFMVSMLRIGYLHFKRGETEKTGVFREKLSAPRGHVYDRNGRRNVVVGNLPACEVWAELHPMTVRGTKGVIAVELARCFSRPVDEIASRLARDSGCIRIAWKVDEKLVEPLRKWTQTGELRIEEAPLRYYPHGELMCHVLGFVNFEGYGSAGIEQRYDVYLRGCPGLIEGRCDGRVKQREELYWERIRQVRPIPGGDIYLTIDLNLQYLAEQALDRAVKRYNASGGCVIVEAVRTGEILAMASRPAYDPNDYRKADENSLLNRAIGWVYEPGSCLKVATIAAAIDAGTVTPDTVFFCENGCWVYNGKPLRDVHGNGDLTVADIIKKSSNIGAAKVALTLRPETLYKYLRQFGLGRPLGIDLPGEEGGLLRPPSRWSNICATRIAMGQSVGVTALQMLGIVSAIANDGVLMRPYVVSRIEDERGREIYRGVPREIGRAIKPETAKIMRYLMQRVTEEGGTGTAARIAECNVGGKTGTAQKVHNGSYVADYVASFVGFLPVESPRIAVIVSIDSPKGSYFGGTVAAPVFKEIAEFAVRRFGFEEPGIENETTVASR
jgi:cell division protein FtsI (penicillin-binding protein 3)